MAEYPDGISPTQAFNSTTRVETWIRKPCPDFSVDLLHDSAGHARAKTFQLTHTSMVGGLFGRLAVPVQFMSTFRTMIAGLIEAGSCMFLVEKLIGFKQLEAGEARTTSYLADIDKMPLPIGERILIAAVASRVLSELSPGGSVDDSRVWVAVPCYAMVPKEDAGSFGPYTGAGVPQYHPVRAGNMHLHGPAVKQNEAPAITEEIFRRVLGMPSVFPELTRQVTEMAGSTEIDKGLSALFTKGVVDSTISSMRVPGALKHNKGKLVTKAYMACCSVHTTADGNLCVEVGPECLQPDTMRPEDGRAGWAKLFRVLGVQLEPEVESVIDTKVIGQFVRCACTKKVQSIFNRGVGAGDKVSVSDTCGFKSSETFCHNVSAAIELGRDGSSGRNSFLQDTLKKLSQANFLSNFMGQLLGMYNEVLRHGGQAPLSVMPVSTVRINPKRYDYCILTLPPHLPKVCGRRKTPHGSNNQYIIVDASSSKRMAVLKCHDSECHAYDRKYGIMNKCVVRLSDESLKELCMFLPQRPLSLPQQDAIVSDARRKRPLETSNSQERAKRVWEAMQRARPDVYSK